MKRPMKKRALALVLALGMAAALSSPALAAGGDASGASVTGEPYYGTDYVQFEIHGADGMFYDVLYNGAEIYQHVSYTDPDYDGVNPVAIELEDGQDPAGYSLVVYEGRTPDSGVITASARIAGIYAKPEGRSGTRIGSVAVPEGTAPDLTALAATFVDATGDYDLAPGTASVPLKNGNYEIPYTRYTAPSLDARITYDKAEDTEFSFDAYGNLTVHSGPDAEWVGDTTLNLYDTKRDVTITKQVTEEVVRRVDRVVHTVRSIPQTGDGAPIVLVASLSLCGILFIIYLQERKRANRRDK